MLRRNTILLLLAALGAVAQEQVAPYFPTPQTIVDNRLPLGALKAREKFYDLSSGGRIVIMAARKYPADASGVERDDAFYKQISRRIQTLGLGPVAIERVTPLFEKQLKKGTRIVAHGFEFPAWTPAKIVDIDDDGEGRSHRLYLYRR